MTVQQERRIQSLTEQVAAWKSIVHTYQTETDKKLADGLFETKIELANLRSVHEQTVETILNKESELAELRTQYASALRSLNAFQIAVMSVEKLHVENDGVCDYCFSITTIESVYTWPCDTAKAVGADE